MSLSFKALGVLAGAVGAVVVAAAETLPPPDSFWPNSAVGWFSAVTSGITIVVAVVAVFRWYRAPVTTAIAEAEARQTKAVADMEKRLTHALDDAARENGQERDRFRESVTSQMNGFGERVKQLETDAGSVDGIVNGLLMSMAESKQDRKYHGEALQRIEAGLEKMREQHHAQLQELMRAIGATTRHP